MTLAADELRLAEYRRVWRAGGAMGVLALDPVFWLMMQIAMVVGFATSYPVNRWLIHAGIKEAM